MTFTFNTGVVFATIVTMGYAWLTFLWVGRQAYALYECKKFSKGINDVILPMIERMYRNKAAGDMTVDIKDLETIVSLSKTINWGRVNKKSGYIGQWQLRDADILMQSLLNTHVIAYLIIERMSDPFGKGVKQNLDMSCFTKDFTLLIDRFLEAKDSFVLVGNTVEYSCRFILYVKIAVSAAFLLPLWCLWFN